MMQMSEPEDCNLYQQQSHLPTAYTGNLNTLHAVHPIALCVFTQLWQHIVNMLFAQIKGPGHVCRTMRPT